MNEQPRHAAIYGRSSSAKQKSINEQLAENRDACKTNGWRVRVELSDPTSASRYATKVRENWASLLSMLPKLDVVVLWEPSRGDRTLASWASFLDSCREHGVQIHAVTHNRTYDPSNARDYRSLAEDGVDSAYESDKISARVRRGQGASAVAGRPHAPVTYGYMRQYDPVTRAFVAQVEHPEQADVVRDIIGSVGAEVSLHSICQRLNKEGVPTARTASAWRTNTIRSIALNPAYRPHPDAPERGCRSYRGEIHIGQWPPLIDEATWQAAQRVLGANSEATRKNRRNSAPGLVKYLLSGSAEVMSSACGARLTGHCDQAGRSRHYSCEGDRCASAPMGECDEYVTQLVVARLAKKDARAVWVQDDTETRRWADELARLQGELEEALEVYTAGDMSARAYSAKETALLPKIEEAEQRSQPAGVPLAMLELLKAATLGRERIRPAWEAMPVTARRQVISLLFERLVLHPATTRLTKWSSPDVRLRVVADRIEHEWRDYAATPNNRRKS